MRYWTTTLIAFAVFAGSIFVFCDKLTELLEVGTCASGNQPFVIANECPEGTETDALLIAGSVFGMLFAGVVVAFRGSRPGTTGGSGAGRLAFWGWALFFTVTGTVSLVHALTSETIAADGETGGIIVGVTFLLMGLPVLAGLVLARLGLFSKALGRPLAAASTRVASAAEGFSISSTGATAGFGSAGGDRIDELERLQRLREAGALTSAEFETEKARVLSGR